MSAWTERLAKPAEGSFQWPTTEQLVLPTAEHLGWPLVKEDPRLKLLVEIALKLDAPLKTAFDRREFHPLYADKSENVKYDKLAERSATELINTDFPGVAVMGEDIANKADIRGKEAVILDMGDGTTNFAWGIDFSNCTLTWKNAEGLAEVAVVCDYHRKEIFYAIRGKGAYLNGGRISVSDKPFSQTLVSFAPLRFLPPTIRTTTNSNYENELVEACWTTAKHVATVEPGRFGREMQSGALELAYVACGRLGGYYSSWTSPWDLPSGVLLVTEAEGKGTNIFGGDYRIGYWGALAGNADTHSNLQNIGYTNFRNELAKSAKLAQFDQQLRDGTLPGFTG